MERKLEKGSPIVYIDSLRKAHAALVTTTFGPWDNGQAGCNLVFVSGDESKADNYGRQIERQTSVAHITGNPARANCWCWPDEVPAE